MPLPWSMASRVGLSVFLLLVSKYHLIQLWVFGTMFSPEMPRFLVILFSWLFCSFVLLLFLVVVFDVVLLGSWLVRKGRALSATTRLRVRYGLVTLAMALAAFGMHQAIKVPDVRRVELTIRNLPPAFSGFRMVQLTDLHISKMLGAPWLRAVVDRTNALNPDLVVITGDLIDGTVQARGDTLQAYADLHAKYGVITSLGNHEYYFDAKAWTDEFERLGMQVLVNRHKVIDINGQQLVVAGLADLKALVYGQAGPDAALALAGAPKDAPIVLLSHQPVTAYQNKQVNPAIQLSGHTHGGMIRGFDKLIERFNGGLVSGLYAIEDMQVYVSNGTGLWNGFPVRLGVPSEITEFVLR